MISKSDTTRNLEQFNSQCGHLQTFFEDLSCSLLREFGYKHFTILVFDSSSNSLCRVFSTNPHIDAVGGRKRAKETYWVQQVLRQGQILRASTREELEKLFPHSPIFDIGCASVMNIPVRADSVTIGSLNLLGETCQYDVADLTLAQCFAKKCVDPLTFLLNYIVANPSETSQTELEEV
jgi:transcriptional regulator with GAF, ATPase, and Fis domain